MRGIASSASGTQGTRVPSSESWWPVTQGWALIRCVSPISMHVVVRDISKNGEGQSCNFLSSTLSSIDQPHYLFDLSEHSQQMALCHISQSNPVSF